MYENLLVFQIIRNEYFDETSFARNELFEYFDIVNEITIMYNGETDNILGDNESVREASDELYKIVAALASHLEHKHE